MNWIKSAGGPLICIDHALAAHWRATAGSSGPAVSGHSLPSTDYERACELEGYITRIPCADGSALVLGDMPLETAIWSGADTLIVRVLYADPNTSFEDMIAGMPSYPFDNPLETISYRVTSGVIEVFDAACDRSTEAGLSISMLSASVRGGSYRIVTINYEPDDRTSLVIHRFFPET